MLKSLVENKPGAGGRIALDALKASAPDGATLCLSPFSCTSIYPHVYGAKLSYDPLRDLTPVSIAALMFHGLAVGPLVPAGVKGGVRTLGAAGEEDRVHRRFLSAAAGAHARGGYRAPRGAERRCARRLYCALF